MTTRFTAALIRFLRAGWACLLADEQRGRGVGFYLR